MIKIYGSKIGMVRLVRSNEYYQHRQIQSVIPTEVIVSSQDMVKGPTFLLHI